MAEEAIAPTAPEQVSEATPNITPEPQAQPAQPEQPANTITLTEEQQKFISANGGFDKVFGKIKQAVSNPQPKEEPKAEPSAQPQSAQPQTQPEPQVQAGYLTPGQIAALQYNRMLREDAKYSQLQEYIEKGDFVKEMTDMGMSVVDQYGNFNDRNIRQFLDLKAQTMPAQPEGDPSSSAAPTVQYVEVGETITSRDEAMAVLQQPNHPRHNDAKAFLQKEILGKK